MHTHRGRLPVLVWALLLTSAAAVAVAGEEHRVKPYDPPCTERENVFEFTEKPACRYLGNDDYEITFAVKGGCDVAVGLTDEAGNVVRHVGSGVLGANAPAPFQRNSLRQKLRWDGKDDLKNYVKDPGKLRVRVSLGLKPVFDKLLGDGGLQHLPGAVWGLAADESGLYVFVKGANLLGNVRLRKFDHDGKFVKTLYPPAGDVPAERLGGMGYVEYEPGKREIQGPVLKESVSTWGGYALPGLGWGQGPRDCRPAVAAGGLWFFTAGSRKGEGFSLRRLETDGGTTVDGVFGRRFSHDFFRGALTASPDGKYIYALCIGGVGGLKLSPAVFRCSVAGREGGELFLGAERPGTDDHHFNGPAGLDCDAQGRIYVADALNNRVQIFSPDGNFIKRLEVSRPTLVLVHQKSGGIYVFHSASKDGGTTARLTKFTSFERPTAEKHLDGVETRVAALDSWSTPPRLWTAGSDTENGWYSGAGYVAVGPGLRIWEETDAGFRLFADFCREAREKAQAPVDKVLTGTLGNLVSCDPTRETAYAAPAKSSGRRVFDLGTGRYLGWVSFPGAAIVQDVAFDKRGYLHAHFVPTHYLPGVGRLDPAQAEPAGAGGKGEKTLRYPETPYDYGVEKGLEKGGEYAWKGALPTKCQAGAKGFQDGLGVDMSGNLAVQSNIYYVPRMEEEGLRFSGAGGAGRVGEGRVVNMNFGDGNLRRMHEDAARTGESLYFIKRQPGWPLCGATLWTFDRTGELKQEAAAVVGDLVNGVQLDEDGRLYFVAARPRAGGKGYFLAGQGGTFGAPDDKLNRNPFTGTLLKTRGENVRFLYRNSIIPMEEPPARPPELVATDFADSFGRPENDCWVEGAEWLYAGASPIVAEGCSCPTMRFHTDWYKRTFVPETYRHSFAVLDAAGNLLLHLGRYGVYGEPGTLAPAPDGSVPLALARFISGTDQYLVLDDWHERLVVLRLTYHAEADVPVTMKR